jgi:hypothetical protein
MADTNARIMDMVRKEIAKNPSISSQALFDKAKKADKQIGDLSVRQFHARYPLQVKRAGAIARKAGGRGRAAAKKAGAGRGRGGARKAGRVGRPPKKAGAGRGGARKAGRVGRPPGKKAARRGRPPGSGKKAAAKSAAPNGRRRGRPPRAAAAGAPGRDAVRSLLLQFARDIAAAEGKADVVELIGSVDRWVDRLLAAAR